MLYIEPGKRRFAIRIATKAGTSSVTQWLLNHALGTDAAAAVRQQYRHARAWADNWMRDEGYFQSSDTIQFDGPVIMVHAQPERRIYGHWWNMRNRRVHEHTDESFDQWIRRIHTRRHQSKDLEWHTRLQVAFLGYLENQNNVVPATRLGELPGLISLLVGERLPAMPIANMRGSSVGEDLANIVDEDAYALLRAYCSYDRVAGWDGELFKWSWS